MQEWQMYFIQKKSVAKRRHLSFREDDERLVDRFQNGRIRQGCLQHHKIALICGGYLMMGDIDVDPITNMFLCSRCETLYKGDPQEASSCWK